MGVSTEDLKAKIESAIPDVSYCNVEDISGGQPSTDGFPKMNSVKGGCGASFEVTIVSTAFEKKSSLAKHRLGALAVDVACFYSIHP
jgi:stress-induced morphogen